MTKPLRPIDVMLIVCRESGVSISDFCGTSRHKQLVRARRVYAQLCKQETMASYPEIAQAMGRTRNHSTIITQHQHFDRERGHDFLMMEMYRQSVAAIERLRKPVGEDVGALAGQMMEDAA